MCSSPDLRGLWVPIVTPFDADDEVDVESLDRLARRLLAEGARGVVALGTTGEPATLTERERRLVIDTCAAACADAGAGLIVGPGTNCTRSTIDAVQALDGIPAVTAAMVVVPYYTRPTRAGVLRHYRAVAEASPVPIVAYNVPVRTGVGLGAAEVLELASMEKVVGIKQAVGGVDVDTLEILRGAPSSFHVLAGDDAFIAPMVLMGASGAIAAAAHVATRRFADLIDAALAGDVVRARSIAASLLPVVLAGFAEPNPAVWKAALNKLGEIESPALRAPMTDATATARDRLTRALAVASA